ncbi:MAG: NAD(P)H-hydrate dehydratase [Actinomycetota bacterium]|nr:NAD(P)H-hydrate dehydratase [Actinomycetota bacterium]
MRVVYSREMKALDRAAIEEGIPSLDLMERAGRAVAEQARDMLGLCTGRELAVLAGKGNNGGDGFVAARYLEAWGAGVKVYLLDGGGDITQDSAINYKRFLDSGGEVITGEASALEKHLRDVDLVIDTIFGVGFHGKAEGDYGMAIAVVNGCDAPVLAVDIPSGMEADTGATQGPVVDAARTVTFAWPKTGLYLYPGAEKVGELVVADIGIPPRLLEEMVESQVYTIEGEEIADMLPRRSSHAHKGMCGKVLVVAGSEGLTGAAALCCRSAMRTGAGLVTLGIPAGLNHIMEVKLTEVMTLPLRDTEGRALSEGAVDQVVEFLEDYDVLALGPGLGTSMPTVKAVSELLKRVEKPVVLDADGINAASMKTRSLEGRDHPTIVTPHPGELGRLLEKSAGDIQVSRLESALEAARRFRCVVVLKGANTIVADPGGSAYFNPLALPGLATAGSGDVLTGCVASFVAQGLKPIDAALCGVHTHGRAAELAVHMVGPIGMLAGDVISHLPLVLAAMLREREGGRRL